MEYYIEPAKQTDEVNAQLKEITPDELNPEELTLIDPASGSGHILVEAYDLFKAIYLERGYRSRDIAKHILEKNLFGLDIDQRAAQLTGFALMMKGREDDRRLFDRGVKLNVMAMVDSTSLEVDTLVHGIDLSQYGLNEEDLIALKELFEHATTFGSLIQVPQNLAEKLPALKQLSETKSQDMFVSEVMEYLVPLVKQANILAAQYDAVVANPPYMGSKGMPPSLKSFAKANYERSKSDLFSMFIEKSVRLTRDSGIASLVTMQAWMFLSSYEKFREYLLQNTKINSLVQIGFNSFPTLNSKFALASMFTLALGREPQYKGTYVNLNKDDISQSADKELVFRERTQNMVFEVCAESFEFIAGLPVAYWISSKTREVFKNNSSWGEESDARQGVATTDNDKYLRYWFEVSFEKVEFDSRSLEAAASSKKRWFPYNKGGEYRKWYGNQEYVVDWEQNGARLKLPESNAVIRNPSYYFKSSVSWSDVAFENAFRRYPFGFIHDSTAHSIFNLNQTNERVALAFCNTKFASELTKILNPTMHFHIGYFNKLPYPKELESSDLSYIDRLVEISESDWSAYERSWDFARNPLVIVKEKSLSTIYTVYATDSASLLGEFETLEIKNNQNFTDLYGLGDEWDSSISKKRLSLTINPAYRYGIKGTEEERNIRFREDTMKELVSYALGCMMGRYSLDELGLIYASSGSEGFDASRYTKFPADDDGIVPLTDKEWFADDAANRLIEFISVAWDKTHLKENLNFLAANLSPKKSEDSRDTIRRYLCDKFYKDHMQTYKKRPIYWLFSSGKQKAFQCLVYLHRYNESTLARMRTEYVIPLTAKLSSHIEKLENDKGASGSAAEIKKLEKEIKSLHKQQTELTEFDEKLKHYADMRISLDLDDGVKVNYGKFGDLLSDVKAIHGKVV